MWKKIDSKRSKNLALEQSSESLAPPIITTPEPIPREKSIIGKNVMIKGDITGEEDILIQGRVEGTIYLKNNQLNIGRNGNLTANVYAKSIHIEGQLVGDAYASDQIVIRKSGNVRGNVIAARVLVEDGAVLKGSIDMDANTIEKYFPKEELKSRAETIVLAEAICKPVELPEARLSTRQSIENKEKLLITSK